MKNLNFTHGGFPESEAWHWSPEKYQEFGGILYLLMSAKAENRRRGSNEYYEFKRHFMIWEFEEVVDDLNDFRAGKGLPTVPDLLESIDDQLILEKGVKDAKDSSEGIKTFIEEKAAKPMFMTPEELQKQLHYFDPGRAEQLSLFG